MPENKPFEVFLNKDSSVHYNAKQVNFSHMNKLRILHMTMYNWKKNNGNVPDDFVMMSRSGIRRRYEADLHMVEELIKRGTKTMLEHDKEFLTKYEMLEMNDLFQTYDGNKGK